MAEDGGSTYSEAVSNWVFYPAFIVVALVAFVVFRIVKAYLKDRAEEAKREEEKLRKKESKRKSPSGPVAKVNKK